MVSQWKLFFLNFFLSSFGQQFVLFSSYWWIVYWVYLHLSVSFISACVRQLSLFISVLFIALITFAPSTHTLSVLCVTLFNCCMLLGSFSSATVCVIPGSQQQRLHLLIYWNVLIYCLLQGCKQRRQSFGWCETQKVERVCSIVETTLNRYKKVWLPKLPV